jgi:hypothetical protein
LLGCITGQENTQQRVSQRCRQGHHSKTA